MSTYKVTTIGRARAGWYWSSYDVANPASTSSTSGCYDELPSCLTRPARGYGSEYDAEGALVIDKSAVAYRPGFVSLVMREPLEAVGPAREPNTFREIAREGRGMVSALLSTGGTFANMLAGEAVGALCLDSVRPSALVGYWRPHGARIGVVRSGRIEWDESSGVACELTVGSVPCINKAERECDGTPCCHECAAEAHEATRGGK